MPTNATKGVQTSRRIEPELLNIPQICKILGLSRRPVEAMMDARKFEWVQVGGQRRTTRPELNRFLYPDTKIYYEKRKEMNLQISDMCQILNLDRRSVNKLLKEKAFRYEDFGTQKRTSYKILSDYLDDCIHGKTNSQFILYPHPIQQSKTA